MTYASRKLSTFAPDLRVRRIGSTFASAGLWNMQPRFAHSALVQTGGQGNFATL